MKLWICLLDVFSFEDFSRVGGFEAIGGSACLQTGLMGFADDFC